MLVALTCFIIGGGWPVSMGWAIALHGGAGDIPRDLPPELLQPREACLHRCLQIGIDALNSHKSPLDVVELMVCISCICLLSYSL